MKYNKETTDQTKWGLSWKRPKAMKFNQDWAVEEEVANFLYGITRMTKPLNFIEIGTFEGISAGAIGQAMKDNGVGKLWTIDYQNYGQKKYIKSLGLEDYITCMIGSSPNIVIKAYEKCGQKFDMAFIDDGHEFEDATRDLTVCHSAVKQFGYILGHDVISCPSVENALNNFLTEHPNEYEKLILASNDGLFILKKLI